MRKRYGIFIGVVILGYIILSGKENELNEWQQFIQYVNIKNSTHEQVLIEEEWVKEHSDAQHQINKLYQDIYQKETLSYEDDLIFLFENMKYCYGPYYYMGGDEAFAKAKHEIEEQLQQLEREQLSTSKWRKMLVEALSFIEDSHFRIGASYPYNKTSYYYYDKTMYYLDEKGYYTWIGGGKAYIEHIDGNSNVEQYMYQTIDPKGRLAYQIGIISSTQPSPIEVILQSDHTTYTSTFLLERTRPTRSVQDEIYQYEKIQGIPVITMRQMVGEYGEDSVFAQAFLQSAQEVKDEPIIIIDVRGNSGGNGLLARKWFYEYTGTIPYTRATVIATTSLPYPMNYYSEDDLVDTYKYTQKEIEKFISYERLNNSYIKEVSHESIELVKNENIVFILTDYYSASATESFVDIMRTMENVIVVGTNTAGAYINSGTYTIELPYSKQSVKFGRDLRIWQEETFKEGRGFLPDIWVSGDALQATLDMIAYYREAEEIQNIE